jgi:hypothetical protein
VVALHAPLTDGHLSQARADQLAADGLFADDPAGMASAWTALCALWDAAVERARRLPAGKVDERVDGEWSFVETLRHLVFVTDVWVRDIVLEAVPAFHRWGLPPHFAAGGAAAMGIDLDATPTLDEVLEIRAQRREIVRDVVAEQTDESLQRTCAPRDGKFQVVGALQVVLNEEWAHLQFAERDLAKLER